MELNTIKNIDCMLGIKELEDASVDCIYTDVPYDYGAGSSLKIGKPSISKVTGRNWTAAEEYSKENLVQGFDYNLINEFFRVCKRPYNMWIWCSELQVYEIIKKAKEIKPNIKFRILVWCKTNAIKLNRKQMTPDLEYLVYLYEGQGLNDNIGHQLSKFYVSSLNIEDKMNFEHPTIKPYDLCREHILCATNENDVVLDTFMGSGTTAVICRDTGRNYLGFEINPDYCKVCENRLNGVSKQTEKMKSEGQLDIYDLLG